MFTDTVPRFVLWEAAHTRPLQSPNNRRRLPLKAPFINSQTVGVSVTDADLFGLRCEGPPCPPSPRAPQMCRCSPRSSWNTSARPRPCARRSPSPTSGTTPRPPWRAWRSVGATPRAPRTSPPSRRCTPTCGPTRRSAAPASPVTCGATRPTGRGTACPLGLRTQRRCCRRCLCLRLYLRLCLCLSVHPLVPRSPPLGTEGGALGPAGHRAASRCARAFPQAIPPWATHRDSFGRSPNRHQQPEPHVPNERNPPTYLRPRQGLAATTHDHQTTVNPPEGYGHWPAATVPQGDCGLVLGKRCDSAVLLAALEGKGRRWRHLGRVWEGRTGDVPWFAPTGDAPPPP